MRQMIIDKAHKIQDKSNFFESLSVLIRQKLTFLEGKPLNNSTCTQFYTTVFATIAHVFTESNVHLTNEAVNWMAQQIYLGIVVNGNQQLDPNIFTQEAALENVPSKDLVVMGMMLRGTDFGAEIAQELKRRH